VMSDEIASALKMEAARFSETLASTNQSTGRFNPKEHNQNCYHRENVKSHNTGRMQHTTKKSAAATQT
jgi:hypothetical protein